MEDILIANVVILAAIALIAAIVLYFTAKKFRVEVNPITEKIAEVLPQANCGACGKAGCADFANACAVANQEEFAMLYCPVGGKKVMQKIADKLGFISQEKEPTIAVLHCQGSCENAPDKVEYLGLQSCRLASRLFVGRTECPNGCLRFGDCVTVCPFGAISINKEHGLPMVDENKCVSCGACVKICPRGLYEIRPKGKEGVRVYVACSNKQKGAIARKHCKVACIGCMKCSKLNSEVVVENNLSQIPPSVDAKEYGLALKEACPTGAIVYTGVKNEQN